MLAMLVAGLSISLVGSLCAQDDAKILLKRPALNSYVVDEANFLADADARAVQSLCEGLVRDRATSLFVVTIPSMAKHGGEGMSIDQFAARLFDQWQIGQAQVGGRDWETGILLLLSRDDRRVSIEFGRAWRHAYDEKAAAIIRHDVAPKCRAGQYTDAVLAATDALDELVRSSVPIPSSLLPGEPLQIAPPPVDPLAAVKQKRDSDLIEKLVAIGMIVVIALVAIGLTARVGSFFRPLGGRLRGGGGPKMGVGR